jgi:hypothetical protein
MSIAGREPDVSIFALHGEEPSDRVLGRPVKRGHSLATRSAFFGETRATASGATRLDRQLLAKDPQFSGDGFGAEVRDAMEARIGRGWPFPPAVEELRDCHYGANQIFSETSRFTSSIDRRPISLIKSISLIFELSGLRTPPCSRACIDTLRKYASKMALISKAS